MWYYSDMINDYYGHIKLFKSIYNFDIEKDYIFKVKVEQQYLFKNKYHYGVNIEKVEDYYLI